MKKLFVLLLALTMVAGAVFAQVAIGGNVRTITTFNADGAEVAYRLRLQPSFTSEEGTFGYTARFQTTSTAAPTISYSYGWAKAMDGKVKVIAGFLAFSDCTTWTGVSDTELGNLSSDSAILYQPGTAGTVLQVMPIEGLSLAAAILPSSDVTLGDFGAEASYSIADLGKVIVAFKGNDTAGDSYINGNFLFTGVENLSAQAGFIYNGKATYHGQAAGTNSIFAIADYGMDALSFEVATNFDLTASELYIEGFVSYSMGDLTLSGFGAYDQNGFILGSKAAAATYGWYDDDSNPVTDDIWGITKAGTAAAPSNYYFGAEATYAIGKANLVTGFYYDEAASWSIPMVVKVSF